MEGSAPRPIASPSQKAQINRGLYPIASADLSSADLTAADLRDANLRGAYFRGVNLSGALNLTQTQLDEACGNANTKLPEGFTLKPCSTDR